MVKATDKAEAILEAALELFVERGFHGTAVPLVAVARVLINVILPGQWLTDRSRNSHPSRAAGLLQMSATRLGEWLGSARLIARPPDSALVFDAMCGVMRMRG